MGGGGTFLDPFHVHRVVHVESGWWWVCLHTLNAMWDPSQADWHLERRGRFKHRGVDAVPERSKKTKTLPAMGVCAVVWEEVRDGGK